MIRKFRIYNEKFKTDEGYLFYNTETEQFSMKLLPEYTGYADIFFKELHKQGVIDVPQHLVDMWVRGRVIPPNRQGLRGILDELGMKEYNVFDLLLYGNGRCQMDYSCIIEEK